jgi:hypothetical protein
LDKSGIHQHRLIFSLVFNIAEVFFAKKGQATFAKATTVHLGKHFQVLVANFYRLTPTRLTAVMTTLIKSATPWARLGNCLFGHISVLALN